MIIKPSMGYTNNAIRALKNWSQMVIQSLIGHTRNIIRAMENYSIRNDNLTLMSHTMNIITTLKKLVRKNMIKILMNFSSCTQLLS